MEYLRSLKKPAMEAGSEESTRREVESAHTEEFNSVEEQEVVRGIPKRVDKASKQDTCAPTSRGFLCKGLKSSSDGSNNEVVHQIPISGSPRPGGGPSQPCRPKRAQENCSGDRFKPSSRQALECRNLSCDCKTVTC